MAGKVSGIMSAYRTLLSFCLVNTHRTLLSRLNHHLEDNVESDGRRGLSNWQRNGGGLCEGLSDGLRPNPNCPANSRRCCGVGENSPCTPSLPLPKRPDIKNSGRHHRRRGIRKIFFPLPACAFYCGRLRFAWARKRGHRPGDHSHARRFSREIASTAMEHHRPLSISR